MKNTVKKILASLGLLVPLTNLKFAYSSIKLRRQNSAFKRKHPDFILPPDYIMYESYGLNYNDYYEDGKTTSKWLSELIQPWMPAVSVKDVLDWGCGPGRILRHLPANFPNAKIAGCDYNPATIKWLNEQFPAFDIQLNQVNPPIAQKDNSIDFAFGISIFTHLSKAGHAAWLAEMARILRPGGIFLFTTHGDVFQQRLTHNELAAYQNNQLVVRAAGPEGHRVYGAFHPPQVIQELILPYFKVLSHQPGNKHDGQLDQDVWIVQKS